MFMCVHVCMCACVCVHVCIRFVRVLARITIHKVSVEGDGALGVGG